MRQCPREVRRIPVGVLGAPSFLVTKYHVDISWLPEDLLYKEIPLNLYASTKNVMDKVCVFIP